MRSRLLGISLLATLASTTTFAQVAPVVHPYAEDMLALTIPERNLITGYLNSSPVFGNPRIGESSKEVIVQVEKNNYYSPPSTSVVYSETCTVTITNLSTIINVTPPDIYVHKKQTIKMSPIDCAYEDDGSIDIEGVFPEGVTSEVKRVSGFFPELAAALTQWESWTIAGKNLKYLWSDEGVNEDGSTYVLNDSGTMNFGATSILCSDTKNIFTAVTRGELTYEENLYNYVGNFKETSTTTCSAPKPVLGKLNGDLMSIVLDEGTQYCSEQNDSIETCVSDPASLEFPAELLPSFPLLPDVSAE
jgi:hypothetical protein